MMLILFIFFSLIHDLSVNGTNSPTETPTITTFSPTNTPTNYPSISPTNNPSITPTIQSGCEITPWVSSNIFNYGTDYTIELDIHILSKYGYDCSENYEVNINITGPIYQWFAIAFGADNGLMSDNPFTIGIDHSELEYSEWILEQYTAVPHHPHQCYESFRYTMDNYTTVGLNCDPFGKFDFISAGITDNNINILYAGSTSNDISNINPFGIPAHSNTERGSDNIVFTQDTVYHILPEDIETNSPTQMPLKNDWAGCHIYSWKGLKKLMFNIEYGIKVDIVVNEYDGMDCVNNDTVKIKLESILYGWYSIAFGADNGVMNDEPFGLIIDNEGLYEYMLYQYGGILNNNTQCSEVYRENIDGITKIEINCDGNGVFNFVGKIRNEDKISILFAGSMEGLSDGESVFNADGVSHDMYLSGSGVIILDKLPDKYVPPNANCNHEYLLGSNMFEYSDGYSITVNVMINCSNNLIDAINIDISGPIYSWFSIAFGADNGLMSDNPLAFVIDNTESIYSEYILLDHDAKLNSPAQCSMESSNITNEIITVSLNCEEYTYFNFINAINEQQINVLYAGSIDGTSQESHTFNSPPHSNETRGSGILTLIGSNDITPDPTKAPTTNPTRNTLNPTIPTLIPSMKPTPLPTLANPTKLEYSIPTRVISQYIMKINMNFDVCSINIDEAGVYRDRFTTALETSITICGSNIDINCIITSINEINCNGFGLINGININASIVSQNEIYNNELNAIISNPNTFTNNYQTGLITLFDDPNIYVENININSDSNDSDQNNDTRNIMMTTIYVSIGVVILGFILFKLYGYYNISKMNKIQSSKSKPKRRKSRYDSSDDSYRDFDRSNEFNSIYQY